MKNIKRISMIAVLFLTLLAIVSINFKNTTYAATDELEELIMDGKKLNISIKINLYLFQKRTMKTMLRCVEHGWQQFGISIWINKMVKANMQLMIGKAVF